MLRNRQITCSIVPDSAPFAAFSNEVLIFRDGTAVFSAGFEGGGPEYWTPVGPYARSISGSAVFPELPGWVAVGGLSLLVGPINQRFLDR